MKTLATSVTDALASDQLSFFALISIGFRSGTVYLTDFSRDLPYGGNTFTSDGGLSEYEPPNLSPTVDREAYKLSMIDHANELQAEFRLGAIGVPVSILLGFLDPSGNPILTTDEVLPAYTGKIAGVSIDNDFESKRAVIELSSPMGNLDQTNTFYTTKAGMNQVNTSDTSFNQLFKGSADIKLKWGKS